MRIKLSVAVVTIALVAGYHRGLAQEAANVVAEDCRGTQDYCCFDPQWTIFGEFLYLRPRNAEVVYAVPMDGPITPGDVPIQVGRMGVVDPDYSPAFRVGFARALDCWANVGVTYTRFESSTVDEIPVGQLVPPAVLRSTILHPSSANAATNFSGATATLDIDFEFVDLDYRRIFAADERFMINYLVGARYGRLQQDFSSQFVNGGVETVVTDIAFHGGGIRLGLEGERHACNCGLMVYGRGVANFLAGEFRTHHFQRSSFDPVIVDAYWDAGRVITILDLEVGIGWASANGRWRMTAGYLFSTWLNSVKTDDLIGAVQTNDFVNLGDGSNFGSGLTFDGLTARAEYRW